MKHSKITAVILIIVISVIMGSMVAYNKFHKDDDAEIYKAAVVSDRAKARERDAMRKEQQDLQNKMYVSVMDAINMYMPGIMFYDDILSADEGSESKSYPSIVRSLLFSDNYNVSVGFSEAGAALSDGQTNRWLPVIFIGNDANADAQQVMEQQRALIDGKERYIVISTYLGDAQSNYEWETAMEREYGDRFINLREYFSKSGMASMGMTISAEDKAAMALGKTPPGLMEKNGSRLNSIGFKLVAFLTYDRMTTLGYFDEIDAVVEAYNNEKNKN